MIVAFAGHKGGVGKTTLCWLIALKAMSEGRRVLLVDADPTGTLRSCASVATEAGHPAPDVRAMSNMHRSPAFEKLAAGVDMTVIDCPSATDAHQWSALMVADLAVLPVGPAFLDKAALQGSVDFIEQARKARPALQGCLVVCKRGHNSIGKRLRRTLVEARLLPVLRTQIGQRVAFQEAPEAGLGMDSYAPGSPAALEIDELYRELLGSRRGRHGKSAK